MSANWLDEAIEQAWADYERKRAADAPYEHVEAAAETLFVLVAQREGIRLEAERQAETYVAMVEELRPVLQKLWEGIRDIAERFSALAKDLYLQQRQQSKPPGDYPSQLTRVQAKAKGRPQGVRAGSVGFNNPATVRR